MKLSLVREELAAILNGALGIETSVIDHLPDSVQPPCVLVGWSDPWLKPSTLCYYTIAIEVMTVAQRIEPGGKLETLEDLVSIILPALRGTDFAVVDVTSPFPMQIAGVDYLVASVNISYEVGD